MANPVFEVIVRDNYKIEAYDEDGKIVQEFGLAEVIFQALEKAGLNCNGTVIKFQ